MDHIDEERSGQEDLSGVVDRLRAERPEATPLELDRVKRRALAKASRSEPSARADRRPGRFRISTPAAVAIVTVGLIAGATAGFAATGGFKAASSDGSASNAQYCPPGTQQGKKQDPRPENCGVALTPGYWKNHQRHAELLLPVPLGSFTVSNFSTATAVFNAMNCGSSTDQGAVGCLAGHLLASTLNVKNQASNCIQPSINAANAFLQSIGYTGPTGSYTLTAAQRAQAIQIKNALDKYNNTGNC
jgi:hypothetical protein